MADLDLSQAITSAVTQAISTVLGESSRSMADPGPRQPNRSSSSRFVRSFHFFSFTKCQVPSQPKLVEITTLLLLKEAQLFYNYNIS